MIWTEARKRMEWVVQVHHFVNDAASFDAVAALLRHVDEQQKLLATGPWDAWKQAESALADVRARLDDFAAMLRSVARHLRSDHDWHGRIVGLLQKHDGMGSPLRAAQDASPEEKL